MTASDLASYASEWVEPISIDYRGWRVHELPPNGQAAVIAAAIPAMRASRVDVVQALRTE